MLYGRGWGHAVAIVVAGIMLAPTGAAADVRFIDPSTGLCQDHAARECETDEGCDADHTCETVSPGGVETRVCRPLRSALCCSVASTDAQRECLLGQLCKTLPLSAALNVGICVPGGVSYCGGGDDAMRQCHTAPDDTFPVAWEHGDCDHDGIPNGMEAATSICDVPVTIGVRDGTSCELLEVGCELDRDCAGGTCKAVEGGSATYCHPTADELFCCPSDLCPEGRVCVEEPDEFTICITRECKANPACTKDADGSPVPFSKGDCNENGTSNADEIAAGNDPCLLAPSDAGVPHPDAGPNTARDAGPNTARDAGPKPDASAGFDGGSNSPGEPSFAGGGGCVCRSAPGRSGSTPWLALAPLALLLATRRR